MHYFGVAAEAQEIERKLREETKARLRPLLRRGQRTCGSERRVPRNLPEVSGVVASRGVARASPRRVHLGAPLELCSNLPELQTKEDINAWSNKPFCRSRSDRP